MKRPDWARRPLATWARYQADGGDRLAAAVTYFGFLSFFPLVALAFAVLGFVVAQDSALQRDVERSLSAYLPGLIGSGPHQISITDIAASKAGAGVIGIAGLLVAGLGWVAALRQAIKVLWHEDPRPVGFVTSRVRDLAALMVLGLGVLASVAVTAAATDATRQVVGWLGLIGSGLVPVTTRVLAITVGIAVDTGVLVYLFTIVPRKPGGWRRVWRGALLGAVLLEVLKLVGTFLIAHITDNPLYGTFAVLVGLLVWINVMSRVVLLSAAWTVVGLDELSAPAPERAVEPDSPTTALPPTSGQAEAERLGRDLGLIALGALGVAALGAFRRTVVASWRLVRR